MENTKIRKHNNRTLLLNSNIRFSDRIYPYGKNKSKFDLSSPVRDGEFKMMFQSEENRIYSCYLISKLIDLDFCYIERELRLCKNVFDRQKLESMIRVGDFIGKIGDLYISLEMNNYNSLKRNIKYANDLYVEYLKKIVEDKIMTVEVFREVIQININNFSFDEISKTIVISTTNDGMYLRSPIKVIDIYLPNLVRKYTLQGVDSLDERERAVLAMFYPKKEDAIKLSKGDAILMDYINELDRIGGDDVFNDYDEIMTKEEQELWIYHGKMMGIEEGFEKGREEGREEERKETAKNMLQEGLPIETIKKCTNLSLYDIEYLQKKSKTMVVAEKSVIDSIN